MRFDFIFPGHNVVRERWNDSPLGKCGILTWSSVATALAAGLAALVLYCVQLTALNAPTLYPEHGQTYNTVTMEEIKAIQGHERMKEVFLAIGTSQASGNKYIEVWDVFGPAAQKAAKVEREGRIEIVTEVVKRLKKRKTFRDVVVFDVRESDKSHAYREDCVLIFAKSRARQELLIAKFATAR